MNKIRELFWFLVELVLPTHLLTKQLAKQTILSHNCVVTSVCLGGVVHTGWVGVERCKGDGVLGHRGRLAALLLPSDARTQTVDVCVCVCVAWLPPVCSRCEALMSESGNGTAALRSLIIPHWAVSPLADGALLRALLFPIITSLRHRWKRQSALTGPGSCHCLRPPPLST